MLANNKFEEDDATESIDVICRNFIFESQAGVIKISHSSVRDYLAVRLSHRVQEFSYAKGTFDQKVTLDEAYNTARNLAHTRVVKESIDYLLSTNHVSITGTERKATIALLKYIAKNWFTHTELATANVAELPEDLRKLIFPLFEKKNRQAFKNWIQLHDPDIFNYESPRGYYRKLKRPQQLYCAISLGLLQIAESMIDSRPETIIDKKDKIDLVGGLLGTPLQLASYKGYQNLVARLLSKGAQPNVEAGIFGSALQAAAAVGNLEICSLLIQHEAKTDFEGGLLGNALQAALARKSDDIVMLLSSSGARLEETSGALWTQAFDELSPKSKESYVRMIRGSEKGYDYPKMLCPEQALLAIVVGHFRGLNLPGSRELRKVWRGGKIKVDGMHLGLKFGFTPTTIEDRRPLMFWDFESIASVRRELSDKITRIIQVNDVHTTGFMHSRFPLIALLHILDVSSTVPRIRLL